VSLLQAWLFIGVPGLVVGLGLFLVRSPARALVGYLVLVAAFAGMAAVHRVSAAVFGGLIALLFAAGRGGDMEVAQPEDEGSGLPDVVGYRQRRAGE
jgi:hypothetical protein